MRILILVSILVFSMPSKAEVYIASDLVIENPDINIKVKSGSVFHKKISDNSNSISRVKIDAYIQNKVFKDALVLVCDANELQKLLNKSNYTCFGKKEKGQISFEIAPQNNLPLYIVVDNRYSLVNAKKLVIQSKLAIKMSEEDRKRGKETFSKILEGLHSTFEIPEFDLSIQHCGSKNAFSRRIDGKITLCSELLFDAMAKNNKGMLLGVFLHELGHTLLNLWGLPNNSNERTADEFATVIMIMGKQEKLVEGWIKYFEDKNISISDEAISKAQSGSQHPLNIQRISAIKDILKNPLPIIERWNKVLYPNMKKEMLEKIINGYEHLGQDKKLAKEILKQKTN